MYKETSKKAKPAPIFLGKCRVALRPLPPLTGIGS